MVPLTHLGMKTGLHSHTKDQLYPVSSWFLKRECSRRTGPMAENHSSQLVNNSWLMGPKCSSLSMCYMSRTSNTIWMLPMQPHFATVEDSEYFSRAVPSSMPCNNPDERTWGQMWLWAKPRVLPLFWGEEILLHSGKFLKKKFLSN